MKSQAKSTELEAITFIFKLDHQQSQYVRDSVDAAYIQIEDNNRENGGAYSSDHDPTVKFYAKVLKHRRRQYNEKPRNKAYYRMLLQATYAVWYLDQLLDARRASDYAERETMGAPMSKLEDSETKYFTIKKLDKRAQLVQLIELQDAIEDTDHNELAERISTRINTLLKLFNREKLYESHKHNIPYMLAVLKGEFARGEN